MLSLKDWTYNDFLTYLFIMAANADLDISDDEKEAIIKKVGEEEYRKIKKYFDGQNDAQHIDTVSQLYSRFEVQIGGKENLVRALREIITSNNRPEHVMDSYLLMMLKKIL